MKHSIWFLLKELNDIKPTNGYGVIYDNTGATINRYSSVVTKFIQTNEEDLESLVRDKLIEILTTQAEQKLVELKAKSFKLEIMLSTLKNNKES